MAASQDGLLIDVLAVLLTVALALAALYIGVGLVLLPVWAAGAVLRVDALRRVGGGWWFMPWMAREAAEDFIARFTAPRDGSRWKRPEPAVAIEPDPDQTGDWARGLGSVALWVLAIIGGLALFMEGHDAVVQPLAGGRAGELAVITIIIITAGVAATAWVLSRRYRYDSRPPAFKFALATAILCGLLSYMLVTELSSSRQLVEEYCSYGAVSERQLATCQTHVTANHVRSLDTPAARFALNGSSDASCGTGAGPFCTRILDRRYLEEQAPPPGQ